jgi:hypothetical protein
MARDRNKSEPPMSAAPAIGTPAKKALVAADAAGKRPRPHDSQSDRGDRRPEKGCCRGGRRLRSSNEYKGRRKGKEDRGAGHDNGGGDNGRPFGVTNVGQRARRSLHDKAADGGNRHHEADPILRPMPLRQQINREIGSKPLANISEKEIQGIQRMFVAHGSFRETKASLA